MPKITSRERLLDRHYKDMLDLNKSFIAAIARPKVQFPNQPFLGPASKKKLSRAQLAALRRGRSILAANRSNKPQI